jgi:guanylate kinase
MPLTDLLTVHPKLVVLTGPSGAGKSTILRYLVSEHGFDSAPKFTTRPSRGTADDVRDFIFCNSDTFPKSDILPFTSYGHLFGIQLGRIDDSLSRGQSHVLIVGDPAVIEPLIPRYRANLISVYVYCDEATLRKRVFESPDSSRHTRWPSIVSEMREIYGRLGNVHHIINSSKSTADSFKQTRTLLATWGAL